MTDLTNVRPELIAHMDMLARESETDPIPPGWDAARARAEIKFPQRWGEKEAIHRVQDLVVGGGGHDIRIRIYQPENPDGTVLFFHGGGWVNGSIDTHDGPCHMLANRSNSSVVSVNYRKAPEHKFPAGLEDCEAVLDWVIAQGAGAGLDAANIMVCGESSGGNLAAVVAQRAFDRGIKLQGQVLIYPVIDGRMESESLRIFAEGFMLSAQGIDDIYNAYLSDVSLRLDARVSPILRDDLSGLCPVFLATCDHDPLRDEGRAYAARLSAAGVATEHVEMVGALHGIWIMKAVTPLAEELIGNASDWIVRQRD